VNDKTKMNPGIVFAVKMAAALALVISTVSNLLKAPRHPNGLNIPNDKIIDGDSLCFVWQKTLGDKILIVMLGLALFAGGVLLAFSNDKPLVHFIGSFVSAGLAFSYCKVFAFSKKKIVFNDLTFQLFGFGKEPLRYRVSDFKYYAFFGQSGQPLRKQGTFLTLIAFDGTAQIILPKLSTTNSEQLYEWLSKRLIFVKDAEKKAA
jgi:hypothetical protein